MKEKNEFMGHEFASKEQVDRAKELQGMTKGKTPTIKNLQFHPKLKVSGADVPYTPTFGYRDEMGRKVYEDFYVQASPNFKIIRKLWRCYQNSILLVTASENGTTVVKEEINPAAASPKGDGEGKEDKPEKKDRMPALDPKSEGYKDIMQKRYGRKK